MKTNRLCIVLAAVTALVLFHLTLVRLTEYRKASELAERENRASLSAERAIGVHPSPVRLPGLQML